MRDPCGHFSQRRKIFLPAYLLLQGGEFRKITHQAERAAHLHFAVRRDRRSGQAPVRSAADRASGAVDRRNRDAELANLSVRGEVFHFAPPECFAISQARREHPRKVGITA